jgi:hypothetical protein
MNRQDELLIRQIVMEEISELLNDAYSSNTVNENMDMNSNIRALIRACSSRADRRRYERESQGGTKPSGEW